LAGGLTYRATTSVASGASGWSGSYSSNFIPSYDSSNYQVLYIPGSSTVLCSVGGGGGLIAYSTDSGATYSILPNQTGAGRSTNGGMAWNGLHYIQPLGFGYRLITPSGFSQAGIVITNNLSNKDMLAGNPTFASLSSSGSIFSYQQQDTANKRMVVTSTSDLTGSAAAQVTPWAFEPEINISTNFNLPNTTLVNYQTNTVQPVKTAWIKAT